MKSQGVLPASNKKGSSYQKPAVPPKPRNAVVKQRSNTKLRKSGENLSKNRFEARSEAEAEAKAEGETRSLAEAKVESEVADETEAKTTEAEEKASQSIL